MCKERNQEDYINVSGKYYFATDAFGYTIAKKEVVGETHQGKDTKHAGKTRFYTVGYTANIKGVINMVIKELIHDKVATGTLNGLRDLKDYFDEQTKLITDQFEHE